MENCIRKAVIINRIDRDDAIMTMLAFLTLIVSLLTLVVKMLLIIIDNERKKIATSQKFEVTTFLK